ncbi:NAD(P)-dependent oxidoreductase, partial [Patescibacteria group bacterium]|nr:NAD(P)-dependent oxidoreductase [Patescibacteria group bacterium]
QEGYDENYFNIDPVNVYGESKAEGEKAIMDNCTKYYIIRISWLYGKHGKNFVNTMLDLSKKNKELKVIDDQNGSPTYTKDVAERTKYIVDKQRELENGVYHVTNSKSCTWYEFAKEIFKIKNIKTKLTPCTSEEYPLPATRPEFSILLNTKLPKMRTWQEALKEYLA